MLIREHVRLLSCKENGFELGIVDYQFPGIVHESYDSDWLNVVVALEHARGHWRKTDACLLTWELIDLANWLDGINEAPALNARIDFMEPELVFEWFGGEQCVLRIYLSYSLRPNWFPYHGPEEEPELLVECPMSRHELSSSAAELRELAERFPVRVKPK